MAAVEPPKYIYEYQAYRGKTPPKNGYNWQLSNTSEGSRLPVWRKLISKTINPDYKKFYNNKMNKLANLMSGLKIANNREIIEESNGKIIEESSGGARKTRRRRVTKKLRRKTHGKTRRQRK
jgi:hypothetical protein